MMNRIDDVFSEKGGTKIMTHVVAGYPDMETSVQLVELMAGCGVDMVEMQIPFSDPLADGPTIMRANRCALDIGITPDDCFAMASILRKRVNIPLLFMTYANIPFSMGMESFAARCEQCGINGLIVPDVPFDEEDRDYYAAVRDHRLHPIMVVSPDTVEERLRGIAKEGSGFIYMTLRIGITGALERINSEGFAFIDTLRHYTSLPIAVGFGISSPAHVALLRGKADMVIIGSHLIDLFDRHGVREVECFLQLCTAAARNGAVR